MAVFYSNVLVIYSNSVAVNQHKQYKEPKTEAAKRNSAYIYFVIYTCTFSEVRCQNVFSEKGQITL